MIPNLDERGVQSAVEPWLRTRADDELADCDALTFTYDGEPYEVWRFIEAFLKISDKDGNVIPFALNGAQRKTYRLWDEQYREKGFIRCNEGKGRQMGSSTFIHAFGAVKLFTRPGFRIGILADTEVKGKGLLQKYKFFYENLPEPFRSKLRAMECANSSDRLAFDWGHGVISEVVVIVATENAGASFTFQMLHCSEVALWESIGPTLTALERTVANVRDTFIFRETTARGPNEWKEYYEAGKKGKGRFRSIFLPWYLHEGYRSKYDGHVLNSYERKLAAMGVSLDQIQWWYEEYHDCHGDLGYMMQEFPSTEDEMWHTTSVAIFDAEITARRKAETEGKWLLRGNFEHGQPTYERSEVDSPIRVSDISFVPDPIGAVTIFEEPIEGHPYALVDDPANGGADFHAAHVVDCSNDRQVATYHMDKADPDEVAFQCYCLWLRYRTVGGKAAATEEEEDVMRIVREGRVEPNRVYVSGERNLSTYWLHMMARLGAGPISRDRQDNESSAAIDQLGWRTTPSNRQNMIDSFKIAFRESDGKIVNDYETLCEMESFQYRKSGISQTEKAQAIGGAHDDLVMAYCGYFHCKNRGDFECDVRPRREVRVEPYSYDPFRDGRRKENGHFQEW